MAVNHIAYIRTHMHTRTHTNTHTHTHTHTHTKHTCTCTRTHTLWVNHMSQAEGYWVRAGITTCSCHGFDIHYTRTQLLSLFSILMPQVKTVTCSVTIVTEPHPTLLAKPLRVSSLMILKTSTATPPLGLAWSWLAWSCGREMLKLERDYCTTMTTWSPPTAVVANKLSGKL